MKVLLVGDPPGSTSISAWLREYGHEVEVRGSTGREALRPLPQGTRAVVALRVGKVGHTLRENARRIKAVFVSIPAGRAAAEPHLEQAGLLPRHRARTGFHVNPAPGIEAMGTQVMERLDDQISKCTVFGAPHMAVAEANLPLTASLRDLALRHDPNKPKPPPEPVVVAPPAPPAPPPETPAAVVAGPPSKEDRARELLSDGKLTVHGINATLRKEYGSGLNTTRLAELRGRPPGSGRAPRVVIRKREAAQVVAEPLETKAAPATVPEPQIHPQPPFPAIGKPPVVVEANVPPPPDALKVAVDLVREALSGSDVERLVITRQADGTYAAHISRRVVLTREEEV